MRRFLWSAALLFMGFSPHIAQAQVETYSFDKAHTQIFFAADHLGFTQSYGKFLEFDGGFVFDRGAPEKSSVNVVVKTASIDMDHEKWNAHLKNADFLNVEKFPEMTFKSTAIKVTGENTADITGDLTLLGVTKPLTLSTVFNKADKNPFSNAYHAGFTASGSLKRSDFGMTYGLPGVGDEVKLMINVEGIRAETPKQ